MFLGLALCIVHAILQATNKDWLNLHSSHFYREVWKAPLTALSTLCRPPQVENNSPKRSVVSRKLPSPIHRRLIVAIALTCKVLRQPVFTSFTCG
ncbi:hypothetical protein DFH29DRAFT_918665 [Suillus ampliporus]|nr:hypothetical protein DFH29DRAFT_918665 [Suillus ampliporus]